MATKIRLRRRTNSVDNKGVLLSTAEPYYNSTSKHLYIGNKDNDDVADKKHIAEITPLDISNSNAVISFQIGEDETNRYTQVIDNVQSAESAESLNYFENLSTGATVKFRYGVKPEDVFEHTVSNVLGGSVDSAKNVTEKINGIPISNIIDSDGKIQEAVKAKYADDSQGKTIGQRFAELNSKIDDVAAEAGNNTSASNQAVNQKIQKIIDGETAVGKAVASDKATTATKANTLVNYKNESSGSTVKFSWGPNNEHSLSHTITGTLDVASRSAENLTKSIVDTPLTEIFESNFKTVKNASAAKTAETATYAIDDTTKTIGERLASISTAVGEYASGVKTAKIAEYAADDSEKTIGTRIKEVSDAIIELAASVGVGQGSSAADIGALNAAVSKILSGEVAVGDLANLKITADGTTITLSWGKDHSSSATITVPVAGSVDSADRLTNSRTISLTGGATGSTTFDGSSDVSIKLTVVDDSHTHQISTVSGLQKELDSKAPASHTHDFYTQKQVDAALDGKADVEHVHSNYALLNHNHNSTYAALDHTHEGMLTSDHNHDSRYYTEDEVNNLVAGKADANHTHEGMLTSDHNHDSRYYTETEVDSKLEKYALNDHSHDAYSLTTHKHEEYASNSHTHDSRYYTETEVDAKLENVAEKSHSHADYAAVNHSHDDLYYTETEVDTMLESKSDASHNHDESYASTSHSHTEYAASTHDHNDTYASKTHTHEEYILKWQTF